MAIAFDATGAGVAQQATANVANTFSHTAVAGADVFLGVMASFTGTTPSISAVTYGGTTMTQLGSVNLNNTSADGICWLYRLANVSAGAQTVSYTLNGGFWTAANTLSYTGVSSVSATQTATGQGTSASQSVTGSAGQWIIEAIANNGFGVLSAATGGTSRVHLQTSNNTAIDINDATATTTFTASLSAVDNWGGIAVVLSPAAATDTGIAAPALRIPNRNVGPPALRQRFRQPRPGLPPTGPVDTGQPRTQILLPNQFVGPPALRQRFRYAPRWTVITPYVLTPPGGSLTLTGSTPVLDTGIVLSGGSLILTGSVPYVGITDTRMPPTRIANRNVGPMALRQRFRQPTPQVAPTGITATPTGGSLILTGSAPGIVIADAGLKMPPVRIANRNVGPMALRQRFRQPTPSFVAGGIVLSPPGGSLILTGSAPGIVIADAGLKMPPVRIANRNVGPMALRQRFRQPTPQIAAGGIVLSPAAGSLILTGGVPVIDTGIVPPGGTLTLTGSVPGVIITDTRMPPVRIPNPFVGPPALRQRFRYTPRWTVVTPVVLTPAPATLTLTGSAPVIDMGIVPAGGAVILTGATPGVVITDGHITMPPVRIANRNVGPMVLRQRFRQPTPSFVSAVVSVPVVFLPSGLVVMVPYEIRIAAVSEARTVLVPYETRTVQVQLPK